MGTFRKKFTSREEWLHARDVVASALIAEGDELADLIRATMNARHGKPT